MIFYMVSYIHRYNLGECPLDEESSSRLHEEHVPTLEEYMCVALVSFGYYMLATTSLVGMGEIVTKEAFDWVTSDPKIMPSSNFIARLMDDITSHKVCRICYSSGENITHRFFFFSTFALYMQFEQKRRHVASAIECYMK